MFRRKASLFLAVLFACSIFSVPSSAQSVVAETKATFAAEKTLDYFLNRNRVAVVDPQAITELQLRVSVCEDEEQKEAMLAELESYGSFLYPTVESPTNLRSSSGDIYFPRTSIYYNSVNDTWSISMSGYWTTDAWHNDLSTTIPSSVGDADRFGVIFSEVSGSTPELVGVQGVMWDSLSGRSVTTYSRSDGNVRNGIGVRIQDRTVTSGEELGYIGDTFSMVVTLGSNFADFHGICTAYYVHTWKDALINSISFVVSNPPSLTLDIDYEEYSFDAYSGSTTAF